MIKTFVRKAALLVALATSVAGVVAATGGKAEARCGYFCENYGNGRYCDGPYWFTQQDCWQSPYRCIDGLPCILKGGAGGLFGGLGN